MKINQLLETGVNVRDWMQKHVKNFDPEMLEMNDGKVEYFEDCTLKNCSKIEVPFYRVHGCFSIRGSGSNNSIESLENSPEIVDGDFRVLNQSRLKSLKGSPRSVKSCDFDDCGITDLGDRPINIDELYSSVSLTNNRLTSLSGIHKIFPKAYRLYLANVPIKESILGLILIKNLTFVDFGIKSRDLEAAWDIVKPYLGGDRKAVIEAQRELIAADLDDFASL